MIFRSSHGISRWSQLRLTLLGGNRHELLPSHLKRVSGSIGIASACLKVGGNGWIGVGITPLYRRTYATKPVSRPKAHTGRTTSAPRKKAATQTRTKAVAPATRKKAPSSAKAKRKPSTKAKSRAKKAPPKRKSRAKPKAKPRTRKPLSDTAKLRLSKRKNAATIKELKERALSPPQQKGKGAWQAYYSEQMAALRGTGALSGGNNLGNTIKDISAQYRALSPADLEVWAILKDRLEMN